LRVGRLARQKHTRRSFAHQTSDGMVTMRVRLEPFKVVEGGDAE
jgi:hypothetical protein